MENILLDEIKKNIKIVDFGLSNKCSGGELLKTQCGSPEYAAPELFKKGCRYGTEVDIWSLGIITFGMVVGKLPFRTPHSGGRGRNDLVDQMTRGLNAIHSKYMANLSPECRDLLRKLLEPNPQLRLPLLDVMVHPWLTVKGSCPLVPYVAPEIDPQTIEKVLDKVSALTKMPKSKIEMHVLRNRYDTVSGIYNLILDDEARQMAEKEKNHAKHRKERHVAWDSGQSTDGVIKVCIKHGGTKDEQAKAEESPEYNAATTGNIDSSENKENKERMWARKTDSSTTKSGQSPLDSLQIRGMKMCQVEHQQRKRSACSRNRSSSADRVDVKAQDHHHRSASVPAGGRSHSVRPCLKHTTAGQGSAVPDELHAKRVTLSPRSTKSADSGATEAAHEQSVEVEENQEDNVVVENPETENNKTVAKPTNVRNRSAVTRETHSPATVSNIAWTDRVNEQLQRPAKSPRHLRSASKTHTPYTTQMTVNVHADVAGVTQASPCPEGRANGQDSAKHNWTEYRKLCSQSAKAGRPRKLGDVTHVGKSEELTEAMMWAEENKGKITDNMYTIYQRYLANCKPHHKRLSIMQAQEILQHDYKFHAKYGRKNSPDVGDKEDDISMASATNDEKTNSGDLGKTHKGVRREKKPQSSVKTSLVNGVTLQEEHRELVLHATQCSWMKNAIQESGFLNKDGDAKAAKASDDDNGCPGGEGKKQERLSSKQEESLKRQKRKELTEEVEREQKRIERELQDTERVKLIEQYLDDIYTRYGVNTTTLQLDNKTLEKEYPQRSYKATRKGKLYSWLPRKRPRDKNGNLATGLVTKPASILHGSHQNAKGDKKIAFKEQMMAKNNGNTNIRYFNDWSKTAFINYVNSEGEFKVDEADQDLSLQLQLKDASYWLQRHLSGVVAKSSTKPANMDSSNITMPSSRQA